VVVIHCTYGCTAEAIDAEAGPSHSSLDSWVTTWSRPRAAELISAATPFQAEAAAIIEPEPGPAYICAEVTSGGNIPKSLTIDPQLSGSITFKEKFAAEVQLQT
jgi:hypothetical protein